MLMMWLPREVRWLHRRACQEAVRRKSWKRQAKRQLVDERDGLRWVVSLTLARLSLEKQPPRRSPLTLTLHARRFQEPPRKVRSILFLGQTMGLQPIAVCVIRLELPIAAGPTIKEPRSLVCRCLLDVLEGQTVDRQNNTFVHANLIQPKPNLNTKLYHPLVSFHPLSVSLPLFLFL